MRTINSNLKWIPEHFQASNAKSYGSLMVEIEHPAKPLLHRRADERRSLLLDRPNGQPVKTTLTILRALIGIFQSRAKMQPVAVILA